MRILWENPQHFNASLQKFQKTQHFTCQKLEQLAVSISNSSRLSLFAASLPRMLHVVSCQSLPQPHPASYWTVVLCGSVNGQL
ncbi:hypothetical protein V6Z12_D10G151000 [Gossypium hirsutum]